MNANARRLPLTRGDCMEGPRPCPHVTCRHHLDVEKRNSAIGHGPTCSLDVADLGEHTLEEVGVVSACRVPWHWLSRVDLCSGHAWAFALDARCDFPLRMWFPRGCQHRLDESRDLPVCASRGRFVGGVWRSA